jgi:hypothetical protein
VLLLRWVHVVELCATDMFCRHHQHELDQQSMDGGNAQSGSCLRSINTHQLKRKTYLARVCFNLDLFEVPIISCANSPSSSSFHEGSCETETSYSHFSRT